MSAILPLPSVAPLPGQGLTPGHGAAPLRLDLTYLDEPRTHEVRARVVATATGGFEFVVVETTPGAPSLEDAAVTRIAIQDAWEARFHQADLEGRLGQMGRYWRLDPERGGWTLVLRHPGVPRVDLRALEWGTADGRAAFHTFHHGGHEKDQLLVALPRRHPIGVRYLLADLAFDFPRAETGDLRILHERLAPGPLKSLLTREHLDLARRGFGKLVSPADFALLYGEGWQERVREAFEATLTRLHEGRLGVGTPSADAPVHDPVLTDYQRILLDPRLGAIHQRFLAPGEEAELLAQTTEVAIHRFIAAKRRATPHDAQHLLSILEASLLARHGLKRGSAVDPEVARQLRRLAFYL